MRKRTKIAVTLCFATTTVLTGCGVGNVLFPRAAVDAVDVDDPSLANKYLTRPDKGSPADISNIKDNLFIAAGVLKETPYWSSEMEGKVQAKVGFIPYDQSVADRRTVNDDEFFFETLTISSFVKKAEQRFVNNNSWLVRNGDSPSMEGAEYSKDNIKAYSKKAYLERYGNYSNGISNYVLNDETVESGTYDGFEDGLYKFTYTLDEEKATAKYIREVKVMAGASDYPIFSKAKISIAIDENWVVRKVTSLDTYSISLMGGLTCNSRLDDVITYSDSYIDIPEKTDFSTKFGTVDSDENTEVEKTAIDYLTEAAAPLMTGTKPVDVEIEALINGQRLPIFVSLDLNNQLVNVSLNDKAYLIYQDDNAYLWLGDGLKFFVKKTELLNLVKHYVPGFTIDGISLDSLLSSDIFSSMMEDMTMEKSSETVKIKMEMDGGSVVLNLDLDATGKASFDTIDLEYSKADLKLDASVKLFTSSHSYQSIPCDIKEITNLSGFAESIDRFIAQKSVSGEINFNLSSNVKLVGDYALDFSEGLKALINLDLVIDKEAIPLQAMVLDEKIYITLNANTILCLSSEELIGLVGDFLLKFGLVDLNGLNGLGNIIAPDLDIFEVVNRLITAFEPKDNSLSIDLNLATFGLNADLALNYNYDSLLHLTVKDFGYLSLLPGSRLELKAPSGTVKGQSALSALIDSAARLYRKPKFSASINYSKAETMLDIKAKVDLEAKRVEADVTFDTGAMRGSAKFVFAENRIYFTIADRIKAVLTPEELVQLVDRLQALLALKLDLTYFNFPTMDKIDISSLPLKTMIDSLLISDSGIIDLCLPTAWLGIPGLETDLSFVFNPEKNTLKTAVAGANVLITASPSVEIATPNSSDYLSNSDLGEILNALELLTTGDSHQINLSVSALIDGKPTLIPGSMIINKTSSNVLKAHLELMVLDQKLSLEADSGICYLSFGEAKIKSSYAAIEHLINNALEALNIQIPQLDYLLGVMRGDQSFDSKSFIDLFAPLLAGVKIDLGEMIEEFSYQDKILSMRFKYSDQNVAVKIDLGSGYPRVILSAPGFSGDFALAPSSAEMPSYDSSTYLSLDGLAELSPATILDIYNFAQAGSYELVLKALQLTVGGEQISVDGTVSLSLSDGIQLRGELVIGFKGENYDLSFALNKEELILNIESKIYFKDSLGNVATFLDEIKTEFGIDVDLPRLDLTSILGNFNALITGISGAADSLEIDLDLRPLGLADLARLTYTRGLGLGLITNGHGEILMTVKGDFVPMIAENSIYYLDSAEVRSYLGAFKSFLASKNYQSSISLGLTTSLGRVDVVGTLAVDINNKFDLSLDAFISNPDFNLNLKLTKLGDLVYVDLGTVHLVLTTDEFVDLLMRVDADYSLRLPIHSYTDLKAGLKMASSGDIVDGLKIISSSLNLQTTSSPASNPMSWPFKAILAGIKIAPDSISLNSDFSFLSPLLGQMSLTISKTNGIHLSLETDQIISQLTLSARAEPIDPVITDETWLDSADLGNIIDKIADVIGFVGQKQFHGSLSGTVVSNGVVNYEYSADISVDLQDKTDPKFAIIADVKGPLTAKSAAYHVEATFAQKRLYGIYNRNLKFSISWSETLQLIRYVTDLMGIKSPLLDSILDGVTEGMDTGIFDPVVPEFAPLNLDLNTFLHALIVDNASGELQIGLDCSKIYGFQAADPVIRAAINTSSNLVSSIRVNNIYSQAGEVFNLDLNFDSNYTAIAAPDSSGWYDFDSLTELLKQFFVTADIGSYSLVGNANLKIKIMIGSLNLAGLMSDYNIPVKIDIELDERSVPTVHAVIDMPKINPMWITVAEKGTIDLYYYQEMLYLRRGSEYRTYSPSELGNNDKIYDLVCFLLKPSNTVKNTIKSSLDGGMTLKDPLLIENILTAYSSSLSGETYSYNFKLSGGDVMVKNLDDVTLSLSTLKYQDKNYLRHLYVETVLMNLLAIKLDGDLVNISDTEAPKSVQVIVPSNLTEPGAAW